MTRTHRFSTRSIGTRALDLHDVGGFYLSETPERLSRGWDAADVRAVTWAHLRLRETSARFLHLNTHLDHIGERARVEGMQFILDRLPGLRHLHLPVVLIGDFNCNPWRPGDHFHVETTFTGQCYHLARAAGFADPFLAACGEVNAAAFTYHGYEGDVYSPARHHLAGRIDWILTLDGERQVRTRAYTIVRDQAPPVYPSDHYPIVAEMEFADPL
jgi:endonuclease/exonuclease/phosphatase family metal-dependent hydrolase